MDTLFKALHGEGEVPLRLRGVYDELKALTDWEQASRIDFDPDMATVSDYFYRGWKMSDNLAKAFAGAFTAAAQANSVMQNIYKQPEGGYKKGATPDTEELEKLVAQYRVIAKRVQDQLNDIQADNIDVQF